MSDIVSFQKAKEERSPHLSGPAQCTACKHTWVAVAPVGTTTMDCPACGNHRGVFRGHMRTEEGRKIFVCNTCKGDVFEVRPDDVLCIGCGTIHLPWAKP